VPDIIPYSDDSSRVNVNAHLRYPGIDSPYSTARDGCENYKKVLGFAALNLCGQRDEVYSA